MVPIAVLPSELLLCKVMELTHWEVAEVLGISVNRSKVMNLLLSESKGRLHRGSALSSGRCGQEIPGHIFAVAHHYASNPSLAIPVGQFTIQLTSCAQFASRNVSLPRAVRDPFGAGFLVTIQRGRPRQALELVWPVRYKQLCREASIPYRLPAACSFCQ